MSLWAWFNLHASMHIYIYIYICIYTYAFSPDRPYASHHDDLDIFIHIYIYVYMHHLRGVSKFANRAGRAGLRSTIGRGTQLFLRVSG